MVSVHFRVFTRCWHFGTVPISLFTTNFFSRSIHVYLLCIVCNLFYGVSVPCTIHLYIRLCSVFDSSSESDLFLVSIALKYGLLYHRFLGNVLVKLLFLSMYVYLCFIMDNSIRSCISYVFRPLCLLCACLVIMEILSSWCFISIFCLFPCDP